MRFKSFRNAVLQMGEKRGKNSGCAVSLDFWSLNRRGLLKECIHTDRVRKCWRAKRVEEATMDEKWKKYGPQIRLGCESKQDLCFFLIARDANNVGSLNSTESSSSEG